MTVPCVCLVGDRLESVDCVHLQSEPAAFPGVGSQCARKLDVVNPSPLETNWNSGPGSRQALKRCLIGVFVQPCVLSVDLPGKDTLKLYLALRTLQTETVYQAQAAVYVSSFMAPLLSVL